MPCIVPLASYVACTVTRRPTGYPLLAPPQYAARTSMCAALAASAPPAARCTPAHGRHACSAAGNACPPLHVARAAGRTHVRAWGRMCAPHTLYACARPPCTSHVSQALCRSLYACASARRARSAVLRTLMLTPVDADAIDTGVDTPITTTNTFSNEFSL
ncbi:hypothetical protein GGX14DRAFT_553596 [Mycena pura]|uniref:Uncharacterized protein n=1 Tax=Mycena pura TaxID=153505 RepID=A0AAD6YUJ1_9AGAR|nr:hypothetical protein GGX14DRAFT_553596 [Mycena pura]